MSLVSKNVYVSSFEFAKNSKWLRDRGITHIVNSAVELQNMYPNQFTYFNAYMHDNLIENVIPSLKQASKFIENALDNGGVVLVHCFAGMSRSTSIILFFLMKNYNLTLEKALLHLKKIHPPTSPNDNYINQLRSCSPKEQSYLPHNKL